MPMSEEAKNKMRKGVGKRNTPCNICKKPIFIWQEKIQLLRITSTKHSSGYGYSRKSGAIRTYHAKCFFKLPEVEKLLSRDKIRRSK